MCFCESVCFSLAHVCNLTLWPSGSDQSSVVSPAALFSLQTTCTLFQIHCVAWPSSARDNWLLPIKVQQITPKKYFPLYLSLFSQMSFHTRVMIRGRLSTIGYSNVYQLLSSQESLKYRSDRICKRVHRLVNLLQTHKPHHICHAVLLKSLQGALQI